MTEVVVVTSASCHLCEDALTALGQISSEFPIEIREVELESAEGSALFFEHRPAMPPAVFVDGDLFSVGRLPRKKLRRLLEKAA